ncbi:hypothetical protein BASA81_003676 [Batrachochytrium salamandrivorans]|nr:hypothetical protein BASA81_003676 [Batrachochytrium salamandrivorans]
MASEAVTPGLLKICEEHGVLVDAARLQVSDNQCTVYLLNIGEITTPNCLYWEMTSITEPGKGIFMCVPDGWKVATVLEGKLYVACTGYEGNKAWYKFEQLDDLGQVVVASDWSVTPAKAFGAMIPAQTVPKTSGKVALGLHFEKPQRVLRKHFASRLGMYPMALRNAIQDWLNGPPKLDTVTTPTAAPSAELPSTVSAGELEATVTATVANSPVGTEVAASSVGTEMEEVTVSSNEAEPVAAVSATAIAPTPAVTAATTDLPKPKRVKEFRTATETPVTQVLQSSAVAAAAQRQPQSQPPMPVRYNPFHDISYTPANPLMRKFALHELFSLLPQASQPAIARVFVNCQLEHDNRVFEEDFLSFLADVEVCASEVLASRTESRPKFDPRAPSTHRDRVTMFVQSRCPPIAVSVERFIVHVTQLPLAKSLRASLQASFNAALELHPRSQ